MKIISWNVNGIRAAARKGLLDFVAAHSPDILCLQETKAHPDQLDGPLRDIPGYQSYWSWSTVKKGYSGVALYTRCAPRAMHNGLDRVEFDQEGRTLVADMGPFVLYNNYYPNGGSGPERLAFKMAFYEHILAHACRLRDSGRALVMTGDYNTAHHEIDLARPNDNLETSGFLPQEREWMDRYVAAGFVDTFRQFTADGGHYTWWDMKTRARDRNIGWRLDYFFVTPYLLSRVKRSTIMPEIQGSDHCPVMLELATE